MRLKSPPFGFHPNSNGVDLHPTQYGADTFADDLARTPGQPALAVFASHRRSVAAGFSRFDRDSKQRKVYK
ncbi:hypothetical protein Pla22_43930 [Rubripirellula amarantea]|uniref:Uncharacterized protein n=1 Tax=Rubripirellula amarantea TaxID=2527999 RepID=A0A5C5WGG6_9BACT|nr:hypothetical protein Pla22_43930 [Rubripirellula amarantea]